MKRRFLAILFVVPVLFGGTIAAKKISPFERALQIAEAYGFKKFDKVEEVRFTCNVQRGSTIIERNWIWIPKEDRVTFLSSKMKHSYVRKDIGQGDIELNTRVDNWFINDQYWLLFPFHLAWDDGVDYSLEQSGNKLLAKYRAAGAPLPGNEYDIFIRSDDLIEKWNYRKAGAEGTIFSTTWDEHAQLGPITVCLSHKSESEDFKLWFSDVALKTTEGRWFQPILRK